MTGKSDNHPENLSLPLPFGSLNERLTSGYILTNRRNLIEFLSSGLIKPAAWHERHYGDLGSYCLHGIPIILERPSDELIKKTVEIKDFNFPVIIEIDTTTIPGFEQTSSYGPQYKYLRIYPGAIPVNPGLVVHLQSTDDFNEFRLHRYSNLPSEYAKITSSPDLFTGGTLQPGEVLSAIEDIVPSTTNRVDVSQASQLDKIIGALTLLIYLATRDVRLPLSVVIHILDRFTYFAGQSPIQKTLEVQDEFRFIDLILSVLPKSFPSVTEFFSLPLSVGEIIDKKYGIESLVFRIIFSRLCLTDPDNLIWEDLLQGVIDDLKVYEKDNKIPEEVTEEYQNIYVLIRKIFTGLEDVDKFYKNYDQTKFPITAGLFLFLQGKSPKEVIKSLKWAIRPDIVSLTTACLFSGALAGRTLYPTEYYPEKEAVKIINKIHAGLLNTLNQSSKPTKQIDEFIELKDGSIEKLMMGDSILINRSKVAVEPEYDKSFVEPEKKPAKAERRLTSKPKTGAVRTVSGLNRKKEGRKLQTEEGIPLGQPTDLAPLSTVPSKGDRSDELYKPASDYSGVPETDFKLLEEDEKPQSGVDLKGGGHDKRPETALDVEGKHEEGISKTDNVFAGTQNHAVEMMSRIEVLRQRILSVELSDMNKPEARAAVELCRASGHEEWLITMFPLRNQVAIVDNQKNIPEIRIGGYVTPQYRIAAQSRENFRAWLKGIAPAILGKYRTSLLEAIITEMKLGD